ncbi:hypothetical protein RhiirC2_724112, partial [Rhizophagus irregularis]
MSSLTSFNSSESMPFLAFIRYFFIRYFGDIHGDCYHMDDSSNKKSPTNSPLV